MTGNLLLPYQRRWLEDTSPRKLWLASRQVGKSFTLSLEAVSEALKSRCDNLLLASSERQSRELMHKVRMHLRAIAALAPGTVQARERADEVVFANGSRVLALPANPDTVRGFAGHIYLDEFAFHSDDAGIWRAIYPTVARGYKVRICSTPSGRAGLFFRLWAGDAEGFTRHRTDIHEARAEGLDLDVEELRRSIGDPEAWAQEFECRFLDRASSLIPLGLITAAEHPDSNEGAGLPSAGGEFYLGVDVGRVHDLTVF